MKKQFAIVGIAILLITVVAFSGCDSNSGNSGGSKEIETIEISRMDVVQTINSDKPIKLIVSGDDCDITVTAYTNLTEVVISGWYSIVRVSRSHSFTSNISGMNSQIIYYD